MVSTYIGVHYKKGLFLYFNFYENRLRTFFFREESVISLVSNTSHSFRRCSQEGGKMTPNPCPSYALILVLLHSVQKETQQ